MGTIYNTIACKERVECAKIGDLYVTDVSQFRVQGDLISSVKNLATDDFILSINGKYFSDFEHITANDFFFLRKYDEEDDMTFNYTLSDVDRKQVMAGEATTIMAGYVMPYVKRVEILERLRKIEVVISPGYYCAGLHQQTGVGEHTTAVKFKSLAYELFIIPKIGTETSVQVGGYNNSKSYGEEVFESIDENASDAHHRHEVRRQERNQRYAEREAKVKAKEEAAKAEEERRKKLTPEQRAKEDAALKKEEERRTRALAAGLVGAVLLSSMLK